MVGMLCSRSGKMSLCLFGIFLAVMSFVNLMSRTTNDTAESKARAMMDKLLDTPFTTESPNKKEVVVETINIDAMSSLNKSVVMVSIVCPSHSNQSNISFGGIETPLVLFINTGLENRTRQAIPQNLTVSLVYLSSEIPNDIELRCSNVSQTKKELIDMVAQLNLFNSSKPVWMEPETLLKSESMITYMSRSTTKPTWFLSHSTTSTPTVQLVNKK